MSSSLYTIDQLSIARRNTLGFLLFCTSGAYDLVPDAPGRFLSKQNRDELARHFEAYRREILGFLRGRVNNAEQAEDLLQQVFLKVLKRSDLTEIKNPEAYLRTTARHVLADFYRHQGARDHGLVLDFKDFQQADDRWSPDRSQQSRDFLNGLATVLESLSPQVRKAFVLSRVYGYTYAEIGQALSISPRTVEKHVAKGLARCFEALETSSEIRNVINDVAD